MSGDFDRMLSNRIEYQEPGSGFNDNFDVDIYVNKVKDNTLTNDFNLFKKINTPAQITSNTSMSEFKKNLDKFFKTRGQHIIPGEWYAERNNNFFSRVSKFGENKDTIMSPDLQGRRNYFNLFVKLEPLSESQSAQQMFAGRRRRTTKKRKVMRKRRTNKNRKSYRRK